MIWSYYTKVIEGRGLGQLRPRKLLQGQKREANCKLEQNWQSLKGNSGVSTSWAQMKEHEISKRTSHH